MGGLRDHRWQVSYSTSDLRDDRSAVNILHDFYIPALSCATHYDRVAGYFSSSSLAAASQGFTRFIENAGRARFIVGIDLAPEDAAAIMAGDEARASQRLNESLGSEQDWSDAVQYGVQLLAWMVTHGYLSVKVAIRVHRDTGDPCSLDYRGDGYVHEKWALFQDATGDGLVATGSLNESRTALEINAENLEVAQTWVGRGQESFDKKERNFEAMWGGNHPWIHTFDLPEAVRRRLVHLAGSTWRLKEIDGTPGPPLNRVEEEPTPHLSVQERACFALIRLGPLLPGGEHVGVETAPIVPWPHQRFVTRRVIDSYPQNHLLCDEVGLGKTIEAGLIFRGLWLSGRVTSMRVFAPASLTSQWLHEMGEKFFLPFRRRLGRHGETEIVRPESGHVVRKTGAVFDSPLEIISTGLLSRRDHGKLLQEMPGTDLVLVDEAHKARRQAPDATNQAPRYNHLYHALERWLYPRSQSLLLATATPMQINRVEAFDLLRFMPSSGAVRLEPELSNLFYALRQRLLGGDELTAYERAWLARYLRNVRNTAREQWSFVHQWALDLLGRDDLDNLVAREAEPVDWNNLQPALTMLAPVGRAMLRHTRALLWEYKRDGRLDANLAQRQVHPAAVAFPSKERQVYDELQDYCRELAQRISANMQESRQRAAIGFYLSFLRQRVSSSVFALQQSLERRIEKIHRTQEHHEAQEVAWRDVDELDELANLEEEGLVLKNRKPADLSWEKGEIKRLLESLGQLTEIPGKTQNLLGIIEKRRRGGRDRVDQMVVFTRYGDTMEHLYDLIGRRLPNCPLGTFSGQGGRVRWGGGAHGTDYDRTTIKRLFLRQEIDILLCTDAAAEGLNLQSADLMVNFDLPWNPMLLEQRIGRIDRIGQKNEKIRVVNMMYQGTVEEVVYGRLVQRFLGAREVTGELPFSLLPLDEEDFRDFSKTEGEAGKISEQQLIERAEEKKARLEKRDEIAEISPTQQKIAYEALEYQGGSRKTPIDLVTIWNGLISSSFLHEKGCGVETFSHGDAFRLQEIPGLNEAVLLTTDVSLYEHGLPKSDGRRLHFATYGDTVFEHLLDYLLAEEASVTSVWRERRPVKALRTSQNELIDSANDLKNILEDQNGEIEPLLEEARSRPSKAEEPTGALQKDLLNLVAAALAEQKLGDQPDTVKNQIENLHRFRRSREREPNPVFRQAISSKDRTRSLRYKDQLLWPVFDQGGGIVVEGDPLLIRAATGVVERQLFAMKKESRTGAEVARLLRQSA